jgi:hypothetical protein
VKIGVLSPTTWQLVEKMAALFPEGVEVVGPLADGDDQWNDYRRKVGEWEELGLRVSLRLEPYHRLDFSAYDLLIESIETFAYARDWAAHCLRLECPIVVKACWTGFPSEYVTPDYLRKTRHFPVLLEMPDHEDPWRKFGFTDVNVIPNPVGEWWFEKEWTGEKELALLVLSGAKSWRGDPSRFGLEMWDRISRAFPGRTYHHDGVVSYRTSKQMTELYSSARVFVNLDRPYGQGERPLTLAFTEALSAGLPVVARDLPGLSYKRFIDTNGVCANGIDEMCAFIENCLTDREFARARGARSREIAGQHFSQRVLRPRYDQIVRRAQEVFDRKRALTRARVQRSPLLPGPGGLAPPAATPALQTRQPSAVKAHSWEVPSPAQAYWNQRSFLQRSGPRIRDLQRVVNCTSDVRFQWAPLIAFALEFAPDLILQLGRGDGMFTCVLVEAVQPLVPRGTTVLSLCPANTWDTWTRNIVPRLTGVVEESWLKPLQAVQTDILAFDYQRALSGSRRVLVFWDMPGFAVAECVLGRILPLIADRPHVVVMPGLADGRYLPFGAEDYDRQELWRRAGSEARLRLGHIHSAGEQAVAIVDFASRNGLPLHSAEESLQAELGRDVARVNELREVIGSDLHSLAARWFWFSLNEIPGPYTFPRFTAVDEPVLGDEEAARALKLAACHPSLVSYFAGHGGLAEELERFLRATPPYRWMSRLKPAMAFWLGARLFKAWLSRQGRR